jgi:hypothetical protein
MWEHFLHNNLIENIESFFIVCYVGWYKHFNNFFEWCNKNKIAYKFVEIE